MSDDHTAEPGEREKARPPTVLLLDDDREVLETFVTAFEAVGAPSLAVRSVDELRKRAAEALTCKLAILDINLGRESGLEAFDWLKQARFRGRIVFLTGHAETNPLVLAAARTGVRVMQKPTPLDELYALLEQEQ